MSNVAGPALSSSFLGCTMAKTVLIVEDDPIARTGLATILKSYGYDTFAAANAQEAIEGLRSFSPDLILLDMIMPAGDGWTFFAHRKRQPALAAAPVVVMTGLGIGTEEWALSMGAVAFLPKPIDVDLLLQVVDRHTDVVGGPARVR